MNFSQNHCLIEVYKTIIVCLVKSHFSSLPSWDCFKTPLLGQKNITLNCSSQQKPLVIQTAISWKNQSAKISFLPGASQFKQKKNLFILLMLAPSRYFPKSAIDFWIKFQPARRQAGLFFR